MKKRLLCMLLVVLMLLPVMAGCGNNNAPEPPAGADSQPEAQPGSDAAPEATVAPGLEEHVTLKWLVVGTPQDDQKTVFEEVNKVFNEKLNTTVDIDIIDWGSYDEKMNMIIATGEEFDMCFTSGWANPFVPAAQKGAFVPLDELLEEYGQNILAQVPEQYWEAVKVKGDIYGVVNYQINAIIRGISFPEDIAEKYELDTEAIRKLADLTPYFQTVKENEPEMVPFLGLGSDGTPIMPELFDMDSGLTIDYIQGNSINPLAIRVEDGLDVFNAIESEEFMEYCKLARLWYNEGYVKKDVASIQDERAESKSGNYAAFTAGVGPGAAESAKETLGFSVVQAQYAPAYINTGGIQSALTAISRTSKHPERAMMVLDLLFEDKELYNMLSYGLEGVHYEKVGDNMILPIQDGGYTPGIAWVFGSWFNAMLIEGQPEDLWDQMRVINETALSSDLLGFVYDSENVKNEYAQVTATLSEYLPGLVTGSIDPEVKIPELLNKLESAGINVMIEDANAQIAAWK